MNGGPASAGPPPRPMRKLVVLSTDYQVRCAVTSGALDAVDDDETFYVGSARNVLAPEELEAKPNFAGLVDEPEERRQIHQSLRQLVLYAVRSRSRTIRSKLSPPKEGKASRTLGLRLPWLRLSAKIDARYDARLPEKVAALPGVRHVLVRRRLRAPGLHRVMSEVRPDLVVATSAGTDDFAVDAVLSARALGVASLVIVVNWDNLSSKGSFAVQPDFMAVWGEQTKDHAVHIHGMPSDRVSALGVPTFDQYFRHVPGSTTSPFPFPYVLFAGSFTAFDELSAIERLDEAIEREGLDLTVVYRPHPVRQPRLRSDFVDEERFGHVVIDPQVRDIYLERQELYALRKRDRPVPVFPALDYYPALLENARFVVCPLSTMIVESAIFERRVVVVAYDDDLHPSSPAVVVNYDHFDGVDRIEGFEVARTPEAMVGAFLELARGNATSPDPPLRGQIRPWVHHEEGTTYAERLARLVEEIGRVRGLPAPGSASSPSSSGARRVPA